MRRRLIAMAAAVCLLMALAPVRALAYVNELAPGASGSYNRPWNEMTEAEKQRARLEEILWYIWLARRYAVMSFTDVPEDSWFYSGVCYVWQNSLMSGVSDTSFAPDESTNRAMAWTVLARMNKVDTKAKDGEAWYEPGLNWALKQGIGDGTDPMGGGTREYLAEMLWRCANSPITPADLSGFSDRGQVNAHVENAVCWAVANGILYGSDGRLSPQGGVTRAELAEMVMRFGSVLH